MKSWMLLGTIRPTLLGVGLAMILSLASARAEESKPALVAEALTAEETAATHRGIAVADTPGAGAAELIDFETAIAHILERSTGLASQRAVEGAVRARNLPIRLSFAPSLSLEASQSRKGGLGFDSALDSRSVQGVAELNLFRWGSDWKNWQAASSDEDTQRELVENAYLAAQDGGISALVTHLQRRQEIGVSESIVRMRQESLKIARQRYSGGYLPLQELSKVEVDLANSEASLIDARNASAVATAALENLLGHSRVRGEWPWKARLAGLTVGKLTGDPDPDRVATLLSARPDWRAAEARAQAEDHRVSRDWRRLLPSLDGQLTYGYYRTDLPAFGSNGALAGTQWQGALVARLPLFDRLSIYSTARAQSYVRTQAELALEQTRRDARQEWDSARRVFTQSLASAQTRDRTLETSRKLYNDHLQRFKSGRINADELVIEQTRLYTTELLAVQGWAAAHTAYSRLCRAQGARLASCKVE